MGLDAVEIVMELEDAFQIRFADEDYADLRTVRDLQIAVLQKLGNVKPPTQACPCIPAFTELRRRLMELAPIARQNVHPSTSLEALMPLCDRPVAWRQLSDALEISLPLLQRPAWMRSLFPFCLAIPSLAMALWISVANQVAFAPVAILAAMALTAILGFALCYLTEAAAVIVPATVSVGTVTRQIVDRDNRRLALLASPEGERERVLQIVRMVLSEQLCVPLEEITPEARLIEDLKMD